MKIVAKTDIGLTRKQNQDAYAAGELPCGIGWAVVCDGMGGAAGGAIASTTAVRHIADNVTALFRNGFGEMNIRNILTSVIENANTQVFDMAMKNEELRGMGTTVVVAVTDGKRVNIAHVGDSRAYRLSADGVITQITADHSVVQQMVNRGEITAEEARFHPNRHIITRAVGVSDRVIVDFDEYESQDGDVLLICSDGLTGYVTDECIGQVMRDGKVYDYPERLVELANQNGGGDNVTVVVMAQ